LIWTDRRAAAIALCAISWVISIELGTSRRATREASKAPNALERVVDTRTSRIFDLAAATAIAGGLGASLTQPRTSIRRPKLAFSVGLILLVGSSLLSTAARQHLGKFHRDSLTVHQDHELIETGPYRRVRHPLYTATIGVFIGMGAVLGNWISVGLAALPLTALIHRIKVEEKMLTKTLGERYTNYSERTDHLIPGIW